MDQVVNKIDLNLNDDLTLLRKKRARVAAVDQIPHKLFESQEKDLEEKLTDKANVVKSLRTLAYAKVDGRKATNDEVNNAKSWLELNSDQDAKNLLKSWTAKERSAIKWKKLAAKKTIKTDRVVDNQSNFFSTSEIFNYFSYLGTICVPSQADFNATNMQFVSNPTGKFKIFLPYIDKEISLLKVTSAVVIDLNKQTKDIPAISVKERFAYDNDDMRYISSFLEPNERYILDRSLIGTYEGIEFMRLTSTDEKYTIIVPSASLADYLVYDDTTNTLYFSLEKKPNTLKYFSKQQYKEISDKKETDHFIRISDELADGYSEVPIPLNMFIQHDMQIVNKVSKRYDMYTFETPLKFVFNTILSDKNRGNKFFEFLEPYIINFQTFKNVSTYKIALKETNDIGLLEVKQAKIAPELSKLAAIHTTMIQIAKQAASFRVKLISPTYLLDSVSKKLFQLYKLITEIKKQKYNLTNVLRVLDEITNNESKLNFNTFKDNVNNLIIFIQQDEKLILTDANTLSARRETIVATDLKSIEKILGYVKSTDPRNDRLGLSIMNTGLNIAKIKETLANLNIELEKTILEKDKINGNTIKAVAVDAVTFYAKTAEQRLIQAKSLFNKLSVLRNEKDNTLKYKDEMQEAATKVAELSVVLEKANKLKDKLESVKGESNVWKVIEDEGNNTDPILTVVLKNVINEAKENLQGKPVESKKKSKKKQKPLKPLESIMSLSGVATRSKKKQQEQSAKSTLAESEAGVQNKDMDIENF